MADLINILADIFCQQGTAQKCMDFVYDYPDITQQLLFFVFFPGIFIIIFIFLLSKAVTKNITEGKFQLLVGIGVFVFLIIQGWYHYFLWLGKYWFAFIILLGLYLFVKKTFFGSDSMVRFQKAGRGRGILGKALGKIAEKGLNKAIDDVVEALGWESNRKMTAKRLIEDIRKGRKLSDQEIKLLSVLSASLNSKEFADAIRKDSSLAGDRALILDALRKEED